MIQKQFFKFVLPSLLAFAFSGVYAIVDGLFIGQAVGDTGLAAINVAWPITALLLAVGTGIGMGGGVQIAICIGKGDRQEEQRYGYHTVLLLLLFSLVTMGVLYGVSAPLLRFLGASDALFPLSQAYVKPILLGTVFQIFATGLVPLVRNYGGAVCSMLAMIAGFIANIVLDWLLILVYPMGMAGAAIATVIGQAITVIPCVWFLLRRHIWRGLSSRRISLRHSSSLLSIGLSPFGLTLAPNLVIVIMNKATLLYGGNEAVAVYAVISYLVSIVQLLLQGVGDGCQPLISQYYGAGETKAVRTVTAWAYGFAFCIALLCMAVFFLWEQPIVSLFGASPSVARSAVSILPFWIWIFPLYAFLRVLTSYFYARKHPLFSYPLIYGEPLLLTFLVLILPSRWGLYGVWYAALFTTLSLSALGLLLFLVQRRMEQHGCTPVKQ